MGGADAQARSKTNQAESSSASSGWRAPILPERPSSASSSLLPRPDLVSTGGHTHPCRMVKLLSGQAAVDQGLHQGPYTEVA